MRKKIEIEFEYYTDSSELSQTEIALFKEADDAKDKAYSPYSNFNVGAAVLLEDGTIVKGSNQENIAYPSGICAERVALFSAGSNFPDKMVKKIAIVAEGDLVSINDTFSPCGACRQVMAESESRQQEPIEILIRNFDGTYSKFKGISTLLPFTFGA